MSYPPPWPPQPPQYPQQWSAPYPPPAPKRSRAKIMLLVVFAPVVIVVGAIGFYVVQGIAHDGLDGRGGAQQASSLTSFDVVCDRGSISNAAVLGKPYKIVAFAPNERPNPLSQTSSDRWSEVPLDAGADYGVAREDFRSVNVVACLTKKLDTAVKSATCNFDTESGEHVAVDYYAVQYALELREAKTGKRIEQLGTVNGPAPRCPSLMWVKTHDRKMYAEPDPAAVNAELAGFAHN